MQRNSFYTLSLILLSLPLTGDAQQRVPFISPFSDPIPQPLESAEPELIEQALNGGSTDQPATLENFSLIEEEIPLMYSLSSCSAQKYSIETNEEVTWSYKIAGAYTSAEWSGETLSGATEQEVSTSYPNQGTYSAALIITRYDGSLETVPCGFVRATVPPLSLQCAPSESFVKTGACVIWAVDVDAGSKTYSVNWSGHQTVDPQTSQEFEACYPGEGSYFADVQVRTLDDSRTIYCGSVTVMDNPPQKTTTGTSSQSSFTLNSNEVLEGSCSADVTKTTQGETVVWNAATNLKIPNQALTWHGKNLDMRKGKSQKVTYKEPGIYSADFSVRTDDGRLYTFPCSNHVSIEESYTDGSQNRILFWVRFFLVSIIIVIWIPGFLKVIREYQHKT